MERTVALLEELTRLPGIPGREEAVADYLMDYQVNAGKRWIDEHVVSRWSAALRVPPHFFLLFRSFTCFLLILYLLETGGTSFGKKCIILNQDLSNSFLNILNDIRYL